MHPKKIIKLDPIQQMLFGLLGQQIRLTPTTKSLTADDDDLDNENPQFQTEPKKQQTKKVCFVLPSSQEDKMSALNYVSQVFDHLSQKLKFYENIFINL